jgi:DNA-binding NtrC family response regulator
MKARRLSDIEMAGSRDGIALAIQLRTTHAELPVILMTGYAGRLAEAIQQRLDVLPKPCAFDTLADAIRKAAARRSKLVALASPRLLQ